MKKITINLLVLLFLSATIFSCGNSNSTNKTDEENIDNNEEANNEENTESNEDDFNMFEHYATILTKTDLIAQFGEANLTDKIESYAEGTVEKNTTTLKNPENGYIIKYVWDDDNQTTSWIEASYNIFDAEYNIIGTQKVKTKNGLSTGMSLADLREWNGANFKFSGFGWDYGGGIYAEEGSKIANSPVKMSLDMLNYEGTEFALGDVELNADDQKLKDANIIISTITMYIE